MIVCICRNISDKDYSKEALLERLKQDDIQCATCLKYLTEENVHKTYATLEHNTETGKR